MLKYLKARKTARIQAAAAHHLDRVLDAREEWKKENPGADELKVMFNKNNVFCMKALDR